MALLRTLGSVVLLPDGDTVAAGLDIQPKRLALLTYLARTPRRAMARRDILLALFWPDSDELHGRGVLRQSLTAIRKQLGGDALVTRGDDEVGLAPGALDCDANQFEAACDSGDHQRACALYAGDFLAGFHVEGMAPEFEQWVDAERDRLRRRASGAAWAMSDGAMNSGHQAESTRWARRAVELEPDNEAGVARLIRHLDSQGDRAGALAAYAALERRLAAEYSATPAPETRALMQALRSRPTPEGFSRPASAPPGTPASLKSPPLSLPSATARPRWRLIAGVLIGACATILLAVILAPSKAGPVPSKGLVAVFPFRLQTADTSFQWLQEGIVDLLSIRLAGPGAMRVVEPGQVLGAWHPLDSAGVTDSRPMHVLREIGASRAIEGSVSGDRKRLTLTAWMLEASGKHAGVRSSAEGPPDSLTQLVDRLVAGLLGADAGLDERELSSFTSASLPAIRAFLDGRTEFRRGRPESAVQLFGQAIALDSTFALAGLEMHKAAAWATGSDGRPGEAVAYRHRDRLGATDRAILEAMLEEPTSAPQLFTEWSNLTNLYPDRPETWYRLGDAYYHWGRLAGFADALERADAAFRRGWLVDSTSTYSRWLADETPLAEPMEHMLELAHMYADTARLQRLAARVLAADSTSVLGRTARWHLADLAGPAARRAYWMGFATATQGTSMDVLLFISNTGIGAGDFVTSVKEDMQRLRVGRPGLALRVQRIVSLNGGRPSEASPQGEATGLATRLSLRYRVLDAMSWDGDTLAALAAIEELTRAAGIPTPAPDASRTQDACVLGLWSAWRGEPTPSAVKDLRPGPRATAADSLMSARYVELCSALIDAMRMQGGDRVAARRATEIADSLARTYIFEVCCGEAVLNANVLLTVLWERLGEWQRALQATRRRAAGFMLAPEYLSTFLREEGRLSVLTGDTTSAIRAYRHYLMLRPDPEPVAAGQVTEIRTLLAQLERRPSR